MKNLRILNILHSPYYAGAERSFVNLTKILSDKNTVFCITPEKSETRNDLIQLIGKNLIEYNKVYKNFGRFDFLAKLKITKIIKENKIELVIVHNGRMLDVLKTCFTRIPIIAFNHGTNPKKTAKADYAFVVNSKMYVEVENAGMARNKIFLIPNYISLQ